MRNAMQLSWNRPIYPQTIFLCCGGSRGIDRRLQRYVFYNEVSMPAPDD